MSSSEFISKIDYYCHKKENLFNQSKFKYAIRSMFAGVFWLLVQWQELLEQIY